MAHQLTRHSILALGLVLATAAPTSAHAQPPAGAFLQDRLREVRAIDRLLSEAESARLNGDCQTWTSKLNDAAVRISGAEARGLFEADAMNAFHRRFAEARARPCPPGAPVQPPPTGTVSPPDTSSPQPPDPAATRDAEFNRLQAAMEIAITACNREAFEAARGALVAAIERALETEIDARRRFQLNTLKNAVRRRVFRCENTPARRYQAVIFNFLYGPFLISSIGTGVQRAGPVGTTETYGGESRERLNGYAIDAAVQLGRVRISVGYEHGEGGRTFTTSAGPTGGTGAVFGRLSEIGTSGYFVPAESEGESDVDFDTAFAEFMYDIFGDDDDWEDHPPQVWEGRFVISGYVRYQQDWKDHLSSISGSGVSSAGTPFSYSQDREQSIEQSNIGIGLDVRTRIALSPTVSLDLAGRAGGYYYDASLDSTERNQASFGPPQTRDFTIAALDGRDGFGFAGGAEARLQLKVSNEVSLHLLGRFDYRSHDASVRNPVDGDEVFLEGRQIELEFADRHRFYAGLGARFRF